MVGDLAAGLVHVGRLDQDTEGLLLLTTDGELAHRLAHPSYEVRKTYLAQVSGSVPRDLGKRLRNGIELDDGPVAVDSFTLKDTHAGQSVVEVVLHEGRKRIVRRLLAEVGLPVSRLTRTAVEASGLVDRRRQRRLPGGRVDLGAVGVRRPALPDQAAAPGVPHHDLARLRRGVDPGHQRHRSTPSVLRDRRARAGRRPRCG
jgi:23S rRNA pseudouridine2605 synthase